MKALFFLFCILSGFCFYACDNIYDNLKPYYDEGEANYIAKVDSVSTKAGKNRVQLRWKVSTDPRIKELLVTWNDGSDKTIVPIDFNQLDEGRYYSVILHPIEEGDHIFYLSHIGNGHASVPVEAEAASYGAQYQASLEPRQIRSVTLQQETAVITWRNIVENCTVEITYTDISGTAIRRLVPPTEISTVIENIRPGSSFTYESTYLPEALSLDSFSVTSGIRYFPE